MWLTNEVNGKPDFMNLIQVTPTGQLTAQNKGIILTEKAQASSTQDILNTPGVNGVPAITVYYSIFLDSSLYNTMTQYGPTAISNPSSLKDVTFPVGALEVKGAWIDVNALTDTSSYFITHGIIEGVPTRVALLGLHVVGIVENHPEFVWATFEHDSLAPMYDWPNATSTQDALVTASMDYPFFDQNVSADLNNITSNAGINTNVFTVYQYGTPVQKLSNGSTTFMTTSQDGQTNFDHIQSINQSVKSQLAGIWNNYFYNGSIWINTEKYVGLTAQANFLDSISYNLSNSDSGDLTRGSVAAANITMETYVQAGFGQEFIHTVTSDSLANCFSCHNAYGSNYSSPLNISHVFTKYVAGLKGKTKDEAKAESVKLIKKQFYLRKQAAANKAAK